MQPGAGRIVPGAGKPDVRGLALGLIVAVGLAYALIALAGGMPAFPSRDDCVRRATDEGEVEAVFGRFESEWKAVERRDQALAVGFEGTEVVRDACGRVKVVLQGIPTIAVGREFAEQARSAGFEVTLEQAG
jgi:hypothetical protein